MVEKYSVLLVGAGSMGGSLLHGWLDAGLLDIAKSAVVDPQIDEDLLHRVEERGLALNPEHDLSWDICVLAVKPQMFASVVPALSWPNIEKTLFMSVAAGKSLNAIRTHLKETGADSADIIRVMPNLPVSVGKGMTLLYAENSVPKAHKVIAKDLMSASGAAIWMDSEADIDAGMSVSACGPAYVFLLTEALTEAGIKAGLAPEIAQTLARETVIGAGALMAADERDAAVLRESVTSPGGTTAEALKVLDADMAFRPLLAQAVAAATRRARELSD